MELIKTNELKDVLKIHYKSKVPLMVYGGYGIGKSAVIKDTSIKLAEQNKKQFIEWNKTNKEEKLRILENPKGYFVFIDERLSQYDLGDLRLPKFSDNSDYVEWKLPLWLLLLTKKDMDGVLFFDELNLATPSVLASCYQIIHDREINGEKLNDNVLIVSAGNRLKDKANIFDMPMPLRDRKSEYELIVDIDEWFEWAINNNINKNIIAFLKFRGDYLLKVESDRENKSITPRGWERTSKLLEDVDLNNKAIVKSVIGGSIGSGVANEFLAFVKLQNSIDIDEIIKNPKKVRELEGSDLKCSLIAGLSNKFENNEKILGNLLEICKYLEAEYGVLLLKFIIFTNDRDKKVKIRNKILKEKIWVSDLSKEYGKYLMDYEE